MTLGEMLVLLSLAVLFLAAMAGTMVLFFFRPWLILRRERDQHQENLESAVSEPRESSETTSEASGGSEVPPETQRSWWRRMFGG